MVELSREDESVMEATGIGRADFERAREAEKKPGGDAGVGRVNLVDVLALQETAATAASKMAAPCPNCNHTAAHPCSAATCNCNGMVPTGGPA
jgi:hypothetical protein